MTDEVKEETKPISKPRTKRSAEETKALKEAEAQAQAALEKLNEAESVEEAVDFSQPRRKRHTASTTMEPDFNMLVSDYAPKLDWRDFGPTAFAASQYGPRTGSTGTQEFVLDENKVKYLHFAKPGQNLPKKRLYTVKAFHRDGRLVQLPFELQIQNNAGGDPLDMIGLRRYERKGLSVLIDWSTGQPVYCAAWGCFAKADGSTGFCSERHAKHTLPNRFRDAGAILQGVFGENATTTRMWQA